MRFSITLLFPSLVLLLTCIGALPTPRSNAIFSPRGSLESRSFPNELGLESRNLEDDLERRGAPYQVKPKPVKITKAAQQARKSGVKANVAQRQSQNAKTKQNLAAAYKKDFNAKKAANTNYKGYGKPRSAKKQPPNKPGYRADGRQKGFRLPKQPKTPKPQTAKGASKTEKHKLTQAAALDRKNSRIQAGRANFAHAAAQQKKTSNMPSRNTRFTTPGGTQTVTGKDVRTAIFNSHHFANNQVNHSPKPFRNDIQGPRDNRQRTLKMKGAGTEFPVTTQRGGYQGQGDIGKIRAVTQTKPDGTHKFKGVISHDERRTPSDPGYNDHFQLKQTPKPALKNRVSAILPFMKPVLKPKGTVGSATGY